MSNQQTDQFMEAVMEAVEDESREEKAKRIEYILNNLFIWKSY